MKRYNNILDMVKDISHDDNFNKSLGEEIKNKQISKTLFALRCKKGMTQKQIAQKTGCTQGKISKIENSYDKDLSMKDLIGYCSALNIKFEIRFFNKELTLVNKVKYHFFMILKLLKEMRNLAKGDTKIEKAVADFHEEAFTNISFGLLDCLNEVKFPEKKEQVLYVTDSSSNDNNLDLPHREVELITGKHGNALF